MISHVPMFISLTSIKVESEEIIKKKAENNTTVVALSLLEIKT